MYLSTVARLPKPEPSSRKGVNAKQCGLDVHGLLLVHYGHIDRRAASYSIFGSPEAGCGLGER